MLSKPKKGYRDRKPRPCTSAACIDSFDDVTGYRRRKYFIPPGMKLTAG
jgi:hypothetical protein